jgi:hypothetical protein
MANRRASTTMIQTAIMHAMHQVLDNDPKILNDSLAVGLVDGSTRDEILAAPADARPPNHFVRKDLGYYCNDALIQGEVKQIWLFPNVARFGRLRPAA